MNPTVVVAAALLFGCPPSPVVQGGSTTTAATLERYSARGTVRAIAPDRKQITIAHEAIPGFMKAMTMPFEVADPSILAGIAADDAVEFSFTYDGSRLVIDRLTRKA